MIIFILLSINLFISYKIAKILGSIVVGKSTLSEARLKEMRQRFSEIAGVKK